MNALTRYNQIREDERLMKLRSLVLPELQKMSRRTKFDSPNELAEYTAQSLGMSHWLKQPDHIIWDLARTVCSSITV
jgi:hypothetical protein